MERCPPFLLECYLAAKYHARHFATFRSIPVNETFGSKQRGAMPQQEFERFRQIVLDDPGLRGRLLRSPADHESFISAVIEAASEHGCTFGRDEVLAALRAAQLAWLQRGLAVWI
jgi:Nif11 domain